jgi:uncharacterized protein YggT (Ycf19 family)
MSTQDPNGSPPRSTVETTRTVETTVQEPPQDPHYRDKVKRQTVASRIIWLLAGILLILLAFRFVLALLGANPANPFANFIYSVSYPFVAPFFGLFGYHLVYGVSQLEVFTLVAMAVYAVVAWIIDRIINITRAS